MSRFMAKSMKELITSRQLVAVRAIGNRRRINAEEICKLVRGCKPEELSRKAASGFIDYLKSDAVMVLQEVIIAKAGKGYGGTNERKTEMDERHSAWRPSSAA